MLPQSAYVSAPILIKNKQNPGLNLEQKLRRECFVYQTFYSWSNKIVNMYC